MDVESSPILGGGVEDLTEAAIPQPFLDKVCDDSSRVLGGSARLEDVADRDYLATGWVADDVEDAHADRQVVPPIYLRHAISKQLTARQPPAGVDSLVDEVADHRKQVVAELFKCRLDAPFVE